MGQSAKCQACLGEAAAEGIAELETDFIAFRSPKLGFKIPFAERAITVEGRFDSEFLKEIRKNPQVPMGKSDLIFLAASTADDLRIVPSLGKGMKSTAGLWIVYPKGVKIIREIDVISAGRDAGLKDVKVMRFSETQTALKFVVPVAARKRD